MSNKEVYIKLCGEQAGIPLFMQPWWLDSVCASWDVAIARKGDAIAGAWAYPVEKKPGVTLLRNPVLTPYLGPFVLFPPDLKEQNMDSFEHETVQELLRQLPQILVWHLALQPGMKQVALFKKMQLRPEVQQTFLLDLSEDEQSLLANMKDTTRRNIRQAEKELKIANEPGKLRDLYHFQKKTLGEKGRQLPCTLKYMQRIMDAAVGHHAAALWVARDESQVQAIVWEVWDRDCSYYFMGGQYHEGNSYRAMTLLLWHAIREAKKRGQRYFDFEGSMDEGVERFFRNFGGQKSLYLVLHKNDSLLWKLKKMIFR